MTRFHFVFVMCSHRTPFLPPLFYSWILFKWNLVRKMSFVRAKLKECHVNEWVVTYNLMIGIHLWKTSNFSILASVVAITFRNCQATRFSIVNNKVFKLWLNVRLFQKLAAAYIEKLCISKHINLNF